MDNKENKKRKSTYKGVTPAMRKAINKYKSTQDFCTFTMPKGHKAVYKEAAASVNKSLNQFIVEALNEKMLAQTNITPPNNNASGSK